MIYVNFRIDYPWSNRWRPLFSKHGLFGRGTKAWEFNVYATHQIVDFSFDVKRGFIDHPGIYLLIGLFGYSIEFNAYDTRHWDSQWGVWR